MSGVTPLLFVGNIRSGTSMLTRLINRHPSIYVSHESDIVWILYQYYTVGVFDKRGYGCLKATKHTLRKHCRGIDTRLPWRTNFDNILHALMRCGSPWLPPMHKENLAYIGDKAPVRHLEIMPYIEKMLPDARFIHISRHPSDYVHSMRSIIKKDKFRYYGTTDEELLAHWLKNEAAIRRIKGDVFHCSYDNLCSHAQAVLDTLCFWLGVEPAIKLDKKYAPRMHERDIVLPPEVLEMAQLNNLL